MAMAGQFARGSSCRQAVIRTFRRHSVTALTLESRPKIRDLASACELQATAVQFEQAVACFRRASLRPFGIAYPNREKT
jgi:hypothetical protein